MIEARVPALREVVDPRAEILPVVSQMNSLQGIVCSRIGVLSFIDTGSQTVYRYAMGTHQTAANQGTLSVHRQNMAGAFGLTIDHQGRLLTSYRSAGRVTRVDMDGVERDIGATEVRAPADLVYSIDGSIYVADLPESGADGGIAQITRQGESRIVTTICRRPGGVTFDPRQLHLLVADQHDNAIYRFPITPDGGLESPSVILDRGTLPESTIGPLKTDEAGNLYATTSAGLLIYTPDGIQLGAVRLPEAPVNLCWGRSFTGLYLATRTSIFFVPTKSHGTRTY